MLLVIPSLFIIVPLYECKYGETRQEVVDRPNSALIWNWGDLSLIADHSNQENFSNLNKAIPNRTKLYIYGDKEVKKYICDSSEVGFIRTESGHNNLYNSKGHLVFSLNLKGLVIYTCIERVSPTMTNVRLTHWKEV